MENLIKAGRAFYAIGIAGLGVQQFISRDFRPVIVPLWPAWIPWVSIWAYLAGAALIAAAVIIIFSKNARRTSLILGIGFLLFFLLFHVTFQLFTNPYALNFGSWTDPLKELALSGGAFIIAGSYPRERIYTDKSFRTREPGTLVTLGTIFFSIMLIIFGLDHFLYTEFVATLVPAWLPGHIFWTYFAGVALAGSGLAFILRIKVKLVGILLGIMLLLWLIVLHIPRAAVAPYVTDKGNEVTSVFEALAFSGIAFLIACMPFRKIIKSKYLSTVD